MSFASNHNDYLDPDRQFPIHEDPMENEYVESPCMVSLDDLEAKVRQAIRKMESNASEFGLAWPVLFEGFTSEPFCEVAEEAGDWVYYEDPESESGWVKIAYAMNLGRRLDGVQWVEFVSVCECGDWDAENEFDSSDIERRKNDFYLSSLKFNPTFSLLQNALYSISVARTGEDPLGNTIGRKPARECHLRNLAVDVLVLCLSVSEKLESKK